MHPNKWQLGAGRSPEGETWIAASIALRGANSTKLRALGSAFMRTQRAYISSCRAAARVFTSSITRVSGPIPPGTGVIRPAIGNAAVIGDRRPFLTAVISLEEGVADSPDTRAQIELAANLASTTESDIGPSTELTLGGKKLEAPEAFKITRSQKLWIYLVLFAMGLILVEWVTYHRRITV